ncbi:alanine racemase [Micromonospora eburnea]|uniref:D-serine deaminase, pyridoxal phosphate-dependent n=1 Tax=Micromonospora eburnea TaxID=227316 RepID=A0A1C6UIM5_9ACTN|nr:alanine racemase [Micromonospora eburnea]SCL53814.1 D-serine deaminase, pyridoxal phosphate-dependent [Micromonospora eburnea]
MTATHPDALAVPADLETPSLVVDLDVLERNLDEMANLCRGHGVELLPHAKTHRVPQIGLLQIARGADGLCVAKLGEAEAFADAGVSRMTVGYPVVGRDKALRARRLAERVDLTLGVDSVDGARSIGEVFAQDGREIKLILIVDSGLGRVGVQPGEAAMATRLINEVPGVRVTGVMTHEGWVYAAPDRADLHARSQAAAALMVGAAESIRADGTPLPTVSLGASASARLAAGMPGVTQIRPGIYAFNDLGQIALGNATTQTCAVRVLATVVSHPDPRRACIDAGSKALSQDGLPAAAHLGRYPGHGLLVGLPGWRIERLSEEHGWLRWHGPGEPTPLRVGQRVQVVPNHVCTVFSSLNEATAVRQGEVEATWTTIGPGASR